MYDAASSILQQKLSQIDGVGQVFVGGSSLPAVRVDLNPVALNKYGIDLDDMSNFLATTNANRPKGYLADEEKTWGIDTNDQLRKAAQYRNLVVPVPVGIGGGTSGCCDRNDSVEDLRASGLVNGKPCVMRDCFPSTRSQYYRDGRSACTM